MSLARPTQISIVLATWCPHCVPLSLEMTKQMSEDLDVPYRVLDIDEKENGKIADDLVKKYGDDCPDYLIPQVFLEFPGGKVQHIFTGFSENTEITRKHWNDLFSSEFYQGLRS
jgi:glutaredoxin